MSPWSTLCVTASQFLWVSASLIIHHGSEAISVSTIKEYERSTAPGCRLFLTLTRDISALHVRNRTRHVGNSPPHSEQRNDDILRNPEPRSTTRRQLTSAWSSDFKLPLYSILHPG